MRYLIVLALLASPAAAAPPPVGSDDWEIMHDYAEWITRQETPDGYWCCDVSDGRPVVAEMRAEGWRVWVREGQFEGFAQGWVEVPERVVLRSPNPVGVPIMWARHGRVFCFAPAGGF